MNVSEKIAEWLDENEIFMAFGIIGSGNLGIWDAISRKKKTQIVCCHHEAAAATASDFFNRTAGGLKSICLVTAGAGSSNAITGVLAAYMDSMPLIVISGQENSGFIERTYSNRVIGVQGFKSVEMASHCTKRAVRLGLHNYQHIGSELDQLYSLSKAPRSGPVWIDIPRDLQTKEWQ